MEFQQLLSSLADEHRKLEQERNELSEEVSRLRKERMNSTWTNTPPSLEPLPGQVLTTPPADRNGGAVCQAGVVTVRAVAARQLRSKAAETGSQATHFVSLSVEGGLSTTTSTQQGPDAEWRCFTAGLPVQAHQSLLKLEVLEHLGEDEPPRSVGNASVEFRPLPPGRWEKRREKLPSKGGLVELEVMWQPAERSGSAEAHSSVGGEVRGSAEARGGSVCSAEAARGSAEARSAPILRTATGSYLMDDGEVTNIVRQKARFRDVFLPQDVKQEQEQTYLITADRLGRVLAKRGLVISPGFLDKALRELARVSLSLTANPDDSGSPAFSGLVQTPRGSLFGQQSSDVAMSFHAFVNVIMMPDLPNVVERKFSSAIEKIRAALLKQDVEEVIAKLSRKRVGMLVEGEMQDPNSAGPTKNEEWVRRMDFALNAMVALTVLASVLCLAISTETDPDWDGWLVLEVFFAVIFVVDTVLRIRIHSAKTFWCGHERRWNWFDFAITVVSVADISLTLAIQAGSAGFGKFALVLRFFRLMRLARLLKIVRSPLVRELANMLIGFVLGSPALFWVSIIIWVVVALLAMGLRISVGPVPGEERLMNKCGSGDRPLFKVDEDPDCEVYKLYAEEYCGRLTTCMFTVFRCMIGDCTSSGGQSLASHFSAGFGARFEAVYLVGMIVMIFGLFNVITAIFVEATMSGLKYNESKQKLRSMYEHQYVKKKLEDLVKRIQVVSWWTDQHRNTDLNHADRKNMLEELVKRIQQRNSGNNHSDRNSWKNKLEVLVKGSQHRNTDNNHSDGKGEVSPMSPDTFSHSHSCWEQSFVEDPYASANVNLTEEQFFAVIGDDEVRRILMQLDIEVEGAGKEVLFEIMDSSNSGTVDVASMIDTLMKLRGATQKVDMIAPSVALRGLLQELRRLQALGLPGPAAADPAGGGAVPPRAGPKAADRLDPLKAE